MGHPEDKYYFFKTDIKITRKRVGGGCDRFGTCLDERAASLIIEFQGFPFV